jgi:hemerythrin-like metal-binding protein
MEGIDVFPWDDNFNIGLPEVDAQHRRLVDLINRLAAHVAFGLNKIELDKIFDELVAYTDYHFATEEAVWHEYLAGDTEEEGHLRGHGKFITSLFNLKNEQARKSAADSTEDTLDFLVRWLAAHILESDRHAANIVLGLQAGLSLPDSKARAKEQMSGTNRAMIDIILSIYGTLSRNTLRLMRELAQHQKAEVRLKESEEIFRSAIDVINEAFVIYDPDDRLLYCNDKYRQTYPSVADLMKPGTRFEDIVRAWTQRGAPEVEGKDIEAWISARLAKHRSGQTQIQHTDGDHWAQIVERVSPSGYNVGFRVDITELMHAKQAAEAANHAKSRFLAVMSHEIRTPMNGVLGMAQLLLEPSVSDHERKEYARTILNSGQTLLTILNDILDLSKVESGKLQLDSGIIEPARILHEAEALFSGSAREKDIDLATSWHADSRARYRGDPHRVRQMLSNLVNNALKFTAQGRVSIEASEIERDSSMALIEFSVADTGIGIPADKLDLLFKPFSQIDDSHTRNQGGTGLGLSIVASLARLMNGSAGVESTPGKGSRFWFRIRAEWQESDGESRSANRTVPAGKDNVPGSPPHSARILVVEDNPTNRIVVRKLLEKQGFSIEIAEDGQQAVDFLGRGDADVDLVLMDLQMPVLDGYRATEHIRSWEKSLGRPRLPIIALTADAFPEDRQRCLATGMDDYLSKPVVAKDLYAAIERWLNKGQQPQSTA